MMAHMNATRLVAYDQARHLAGLLLRHRVQNFILHQKKAAFARVRSSIERDLY